MVFSSRMDYYEEFGVSRSASQREIRSAWKRLARFYHPDLHADPEMRETAELEMRRLNQMLSVLTQPLERVRYDLMLEAERNAPPAPSLWGPPPEREHSVSELFRFDRRAAVWLSSGALAAGIVAVIVMSSLQVGTTADHAADVSVAVSNAPAPLPDTSASLKSRISRSREKLRLPEPLYASAHAPAKSTTTEKTAMVPAAPAAAKPTLVASAPKPQLPPVTARPVPAPAPKPTLAASASKPQLPPKTAKPVPAPAPKPTLAASASKPQLPPITAKPVPAPAPKPTLAASASKPKVPPVATKPVPAPKQNLAASASKPQLPPAAAKPVPASAPKPNLAASAPKPQLPPVVAKSVPAPAAKPDLTAAAKPNMAPASRSTNSEARLENRPSEPIQAAAAPPVPAASIGQANVTRAVEIAAASNPTSAPAGATPLARAPEPASPSPAPGTPAVVQTALRAGGLAGVWRYEPTKEAARNPGFYAAEHIELNVFDESGVLHGYYTAHYLVPAGDISPDVAFNFSGERGRDAATGTWSGANGNRGEIRLRVLSDSALEVVWVTTRIKHANSLVSGKVTLRRAN
jgi:DnaJ-like protein